MLQIQQRRPSHINNRDGIAGNPARKKFNMNWWKSLLPPSPLKKTWSVKMVASFFIVTARAKGTFLPTQGPPLSHQPAQFLTGFIRQHPTLGISGPFWSSREWWRVCNSVNCCWCQIFLPGWEIALLNSLSCSGKYFSVRGRAANEWNCSGICSSNIFSLVTEEK